MTQIEAFGEVGEYIEQPIRVYSSRMRMRLAFSLDTATRPDASLSAKSVDHFRELRKARMTQLVVSHGTQGIQILCDLAVLLGAGRLAKEGDPESVTDFYNALIADRQSQRILQQERDDGRVETIYGTGEATVTAIALLNDKGEPVEVVDVGAPITIQVKVAVNAAIPRLVIGYIIKDRLGQPSPYSAPTRTTSSSPSKGCRSGIRRRSGFASTLHLRRGATRSPLPCTAAIRM
jgi:lipopolysaccharide transport system ATP-binding protein